MAYRRFVSYIHGYEGEKKEQNVGFAQAECRGNQEKIIIQMKNASKEEEVPVEAAFLIRRNGQTVKLTVGEFHLLRGNGTYRYEGNGALAEGKVPFDEVCGILLTSRDGRRKCYASLWDDEPFSPEKVIDWKESLKIHQREEKREGNPQMVWVDPPEVVENLPEKEENVEKPVDQIPQYDQPAEETPQYDQQLELTQEVQLVGETPTRSLTDGQVARFQENPENPKLEKPAKPSLCWEERQEMVPIRGLEENMEESWLFLSRRYTKVRPLLPEFGAECLKIRPGDIGRLPRAYWIFCNNSFLLKGYYQFQHLLLTRMVQNNEPVYYLCVPGRYYGNDKFTAEMFGFDHFFPAYKEYGKETKGSAKGKILPGTFGYWCAEVETEHDTGRTLHERSDEASEKSI